MEYIEPKSDDDKNENDDSLYSTHNICIHFVYIRVTTQSQRYEIHFVYLELWKKKSTQLRQISKDERAKQVLELTNERKREAIVGFFFASSQFRFCFSIQVICTPEWQIRFPLRLYLFKRQIIKRTSLKHLYNKLEIDNSEMCSSRNAAEVHVRARHTRHIRISHLVFNLTQFIYRLKSHFIYYLHIYQVTFYIVQAYTHTCSTHIMFYQWIKKNFLEMKMRILIYVHSPASAYTFSSNISLYKLYSINRRKT